jgi:hypothetical protein
VDQSRRFNRGLAFKAEVVLASLLVVRHRAPRFALLFAGAILAILVLDDSPDALVVRRNGLALIAGLLAAVSSARVLARGGALASVRGLPSPAHVSPAGRLTGVVVFVVLPLTAASLLLVAPRWGVAETCRFLLSASLPAAALASILMALTPLTGATTATVSGIIASVLGGIPPADIVSALSSWPFIRGVAMAAWDVLPLAWRTGQWLDHGGSWHLVLMGAWIVAGVALSPLTIRARPR